MAFEKVIDTTCGHGSGTTVPLPLPFPPSHPQKKKKANEIIINELVNNS